MAVGIGVSVVNTRAIWEAVFGVDSPFVRTPKFNGAAHADHDPALLARRRRLPRGLLELAIGLALLACLVIAVSRPWSLVGLPFIALFAAGYLFVGIPQLRSSLPTPARVRPAVPAA